MPYFNNQADELYYRSSGTGRVAVILVHGWYQSGSQAWAKITAQLEKKYRVFVPDLPGHGLSPLHDAAHFSTATNEALILAFTQHIKKKYHCNRVILAGHSYGAFAVLSIAAQAQAEYAGVVAMAAIDDYKPYVPRLKRVLAIPFFLVSLYYRLQALLGAFPYGDRMLLYGKLSAALIPGKLAYAKIKNKTLSPRSSHAYMRAFTRARVAWPEKKIRTPLWLVYGERDALTSSSWAAKILPHFSSASVSVVAEAGHNVQIAGAPEVGRLLQNFIEKCLRQRLRGKDGNHAHR